MQLQIAINYIHYERATAINRMKEGVNENENYKRQTTNKKGSEGLHARAE